MIPEKVVSITSATLGKRKRKTFESCFGRYEYKDIPAEAFSEGLMYLENGGCTVKLLRRKKLYVILFASRGNAKKYNLKNNDEKENAIK